MPKEIEVRRVISVPVDTALEKIENAALYCRGYELYSLNNNITRGIETLDL